MIDKERVFDTLFAAEAVRAFCCGFICLFFLCLFFDAYKLYNMQVNKVNDFTILSTFISLLIIIYVIAPMVAVNNIYKTDPSKLKKCVLRTGYSEYEFDFEELGNKQVL